MLRYMLFFLTIGLVTSFTKERPTYGPCPENEVLHPHESDCTKFYKCDHYELVLFECPDGLEWNDKLKICDWPELAGCSIHSSCDPLSPPPSCPAQVTDQAAVLLAHQSDCTKFYICDWGVPHLMVCPAGLHFNPQLQSCDCPLQVQ